MKSVVSVAGPGSGHLPEPARIAPWNRTRVCYGAADAGFDAVGEADVSSQVSVPSILFAVVFFIVAEGIVGHIARNIFHRALCGELTR